MKKVLPLAILLIILSGCSKESNNDPKDIIDPVNVVVYTLSGVTNSNITGKATFTRNADNSTKVNIELENASSVLHPASIHFNSAEEGGARAITLNACECAVSETIITQLDNGNAIDYDQLMVFDGHINIYESEVLANVIIAQVNIGSNTN